MKILIAGDFCPQERVAKLIEQGAYEKIFSNVKPVIEQADFSLVNFETCIASDIDKPIAKCGPNLKCTTKAIEVLKWAGFKGVTLANNHFRDYGDRAVTRSLTLFDEAGFKHVGGGNNIKEASRTLFVNIQAKTVAFINACEHEFSIADENHGGSNPLNPIQQYYAIKEAHEKADYVIVIIHGGHEHYQLPSSRMQETYRFFVEAGADAVLNHHQHCYSGYEIYRGKPIFYGLGNFCFDNDLKRNDIWNEGIMVQLKLDKKIEFEIYPYTQCNDEPNVALMQGNKEGSFNLLLESLNNIIVNDQELKRYHKNWMDNTSVDYKVLFTPWSNRWLVAAFVRHLLPSFFIKKKRLLFFNFIACEAHRERVLDFLIKNK